ncbi:MAG: class I SAM-dependent methyltransferase [Candidatus Eisenbacteria bacterium]
MNLKTARREPSQSASEWWQGLWDTVAYHPNMSFTLTLVNHAPLVYNRYLARFQKQSVLHALKHIGSLAGKRVLDVGCGQGRWTKLWSRLGADAIGVDISLPLLSANIVGPSDNPKPEYHYAAMAVENLAIADRSVDMTSSITVLQHIPYERQQRAIREMVRCVRPGGLILIHEHVRRQPGVEGSDASTTFPNLPEEWVGMFGDEGCHLLFAERCPLMPLFAAYWSLRDRILRLVKPAGSRSPSPGSPSGSLQQVPARNRHALARLYRTVNYCVYWLLTWPSWGMEYLLQLLPRKDRWTGQATLGAHQTFLFKKGGK